MKLKSILLIGLGTTLSMVGCKSEKKVVEEVDKDSIQLMVLDPGHFHAALVQKSMYPEIDDHVDVYAPEGAEYLAYKSSIDSYNARETDPTNWTINENLGEDFFDQLIKDKPGNVVVLSGNNQKKTEYILDAVKNGLNVYADKPMSINSEDFKLLQEAFDIAKEKDLVIYDIMTERFEITTMIQKLLSQNEDLFGTLVNGTPEDPAITKESVHHFNKIVSGNQLVRPQWFFDVEQQGEGIADVTNHLVDLVMWECFSDQIINMSDIGEIRGKTWPTIMSLEDFTTVTQAEAFPDYLKKDVKEDGKLHVDSNGEIIFKIKDVWAKTSVIWAYKAPEGGADTHYSIMRGTKANLIIKQGKEEGYKPQLYIAPVSGSEIGGHIEAALSAVSATAKGLTFEKLDNGEFKVNIPEEYKNGHEAHFAQVTQNFIEYFENRNMPDWEIPNMITKYYVTSEAKRLASENK